ncbi:8-oxo-dGTP diphosphatase [Lentzea jiangxiensis]|uniref:8-oxo-dGTP diphosphatase n=1 Tax=Lentzea jiangxiensis TaxID=641025 RepID=A0A1H0F6L0_9PSEU|nr:8-oxo-dGTP diphosphatase [Lentzea jiangxiensis]
MLCVVYSPSDFPPFAVTVDLVVLTVRADALCALLVRRGEAPFRGRWALPGGFVQVTESVDAAAARELVEETGVSGLHLEQLGTYGEPRRDPRMRVVSVAYLALAPDLPVPVAGTDAAAASWVPVAEVSSLAFDHSVILGDGVERARAKLEYTSLGTEFCPAEFTVAELRRVYEVVWGVSLDARNFHRKVTGVEGLLEATGRSTSRDGGRPAALYRRGAASVLHPPLVRGVGA